PVVERHEGRLLLSAVVVAPGGQPEALSVCPGPGRLLVLRTQGHGSERWVRDLRAQMLSTLRHLPPR
ncbi:MAG: hypothetical protein VKQ33_16600, partial [Candidatus Sericytochromatia bacterium]|nr:hypothetical protein [Candidatus Sericytochromatia bacterium]